MKGLPTDNENFISVIRWFVRIVSVLLLAAIAAFGLFDAWAAHIAYLIHGGSGPEPQGPGSLTLIAWSMIFIGLVLAVFWEGIGGLIVTFAALGMQINVLMNVGGGQLNPFILIFVFVGLAFVFCWWLIWRRTHRRSLSKGIPLPSPPPVQQVSSQLHRFGLVMQLTVVVLLVAGLSWRVMLYLQPPPSLPADCRQSVQGTRAGAVTQFCFLNVLPLFGQGSMTAGPDGNLWFLEAQKIARLTPEGTLKEFAVPTPPAGGILSGPDGNLWFLVSNKDVKIARMSVQGDLKEFALSKLSGYPQSLITGPDGNFWFLETNGSGQGIGKIAKVTLTGQVAEFSLPHFAPGATNGSLSFAGGGLAPGSDGNLWFVEEPGNAIERMTLTGEITTFPLEANKIAGLTAGPDGNMWFIETDGHIGRITPAGDVRRFPAFVPTDQMISAMIAGPDGNLWFTAQPGKIGSITPNGVVTLFSLPQKAQVGGLAAGPDGRIWFSRADTDMSGISWWTHIGCITS